MHAAKIRAIKARSPEIFVNARVDTYWLGQDAGIAETVGRATCYVDAGADGVFVPGVVDPDVLRELARAIDRPLNVLAIPGMSPVDLAALGVRRVSTGSMPYRAALQAAVAVAVATRAGLMFPDAVSYAGMQEALTGYATGVSPGKYPVPLVSPRGCLAILPAGRDGCSKSARGERQADDTAVSAVRGTGHRGRRCGARPGHRHVGGRLVVGLALLWIGYLHRMRKITWLHDLGEWAGRKFHRPAWVALPIALFITTIITALFGFIWDVSLHIGKGRDPGPLANPAHYFILFGLFILFVAGCLACVLPYDKPGPAAVRITRHWYAPVGGVLMAGCGLYALIGFPLDDIWHRIFGQDVTLWGPTHLMMIGGAGFSTLTALFLEHEGRRAVGEDAPKDGPGIKFIQYLAFGGLVIGMSVFQIEFDFGVMQFRQVFEPMLIAAAASLGPGGAPASCSAAALPSSPRCWRSRFAAWSP